jgi:hypothetical protein
MDYAALLGFCSRIAEITEALCRAVAASLGRGLMQAAIILLVWKRIRRAERLLMVLTERLRDGRLCPRAICASNSVRETGEISVAPAPSRGEDRPIAAFRQSLPRRFGWLLPLMPFVAAGYASQLRAALAEPDMVALLRETPQAARILGPLCRMLGVAPEMLAPGGGVIPVQDARVPVTIWNGMVVSRGDEGADGGFALATGEFGGVRRRRANVW